MKATIEIPKGDDRRRHKSVKEDKIVDFGPTRIVIPVNKGRMPVDYGYIEGTLNKKEGDEIDVLVLSKRKLSVGQQIDVKPIALIKRADGDDKVVAVDSTTEGVYLKWLDLPVVLRKKIEGFFSYHHKFLSIESEHTAKDYILQNLKVKNK